MPFPMIYNGLLVRILIILDNQILHIIQLEDHGTHSQVDDHDQIMHPDIYVEMHVVVEVV